MVCCIPKLLSFEASHFSFCCYFTFHYLSVSRWKKSHSGKSPDVFPLLQTDCFPAPPQHPAPGCSKIPFIRWIRSILHPPYGFPPQMLGLMWWKFPGVLLPVLTQKADTWVHSHAAFHLLLPSWCGSCREKTNGICQLGLLITGRVFGRKKKIVFTCSLSNLFWIRRHLGLESVFSLEQMSQI